MTWRIRVNLNDSIFTHMPNLTELRIARRTTHLKLAYREKTLEDIMPNDRVPKFLLLMLALHLEGVNRQNIAMVWTGARGNVLGDA